MAGYDPYTWVDGAVGNTPIVAAALNRLEQGVFDAHRNMPAVNVVSYLSTNQRTGVASATAGFIQAYTEAAGAPLYVPAGTYRFDTSITAVGSTPLNITFAPGATIIQGANVPVIDLTGPSIEASRALQSDATIGSYTINASTTGLAPGDWVLVSDNATWPGPKAALGGEYHRIQQVDGTTQLRIRGALDQSYTVARTGALRRRVMINGTRIVGGVWTAATPTSVTVPMIRLTGHANYHIADVDMRGAGGPGITLSGCVQGTITRPRFTDFLNDEATSHFGYGIEAFGPCNDLIVRDVFMSGGRHVFTTNSSGTTPGVPRNIYVIGGTCTAMTETCFDSHEEGEYIHFIDNTVHGTNNGALKHRAPNSTITNPTVTNSDGTAIRFLEVATGGTINGGYLDRIRGVGVNLRANTTITGDLTIRNTTTAVQIDDGTNGTTLDGLSTTGALVYAGTSTGHTLTTKTTAGTVTAPTTVTFTRRNSALKAWEDANRSINAAAPSAESGLTAISANASTDDSARLQAALNYIKTTYGAGTLVLPPGRTSNVNAPINLPTGVRIKGDKTARWDFWFSPDGITCLTVNDTDCTPINGLSITGKQFDTNTPNANTTTSTGLRITGSGMNFNDLSVRGFNTGVDLTADNTYIINFHQSSFIGNKVGLNVDLANLWSGRAKETSNSGERITLTDCVIANGDWAWWASGNGVDLHLVNTSTDFCNAYGRINGAHLFAVSSHFEGQYNGTGSGKSWAFDATANPRLNFVGCNFVLGGSAWTHVVNPANGPFNYGAGFVKFSACDLYSTRTANAAAANAVHLGSSEAMVPVTTGAITVVVSSPCVNKFGRAKVEVVAADGNPQANVTARITGMNTTDGTLTVTLSGTAPAGTFLEVSF